MWNNLPNTYATFYKRKVTLNVYNLCYVIMLYWQPTITFTLWALSEFIIV